MKMSLKGRLERAMTLSNQVIFNETCINKTRMYTFFTGLQSGASHYIFTFWKESYQRSIVNKRKPFLNHLMVIKVVSYFLSFFNTNSSTRNASKQSHFP